MRRNYNGVIVLSRRNLLTLLQKLEEPGSACTLMQGDLIVRSEPDEIHYSDREPGAMNQRIEDFIKAFSSWRLRNKK